MPEEIANDIDLQISFKEAYEIIKLLSPEERLKIPEEFIENMENNMDVFYEFDYKENKPLEEQKLSKYTLAILDNINREYLLNDEQNEYLEKMYQINQEKKDLINDEKAKTSKLKIGDISDNENIEVFDEKQYLSNMHKENIFFRIINKIKSIFKFRGE